MGPGNRNTIKIKSTKMGAPPVSRRGPVIFDRLLFGHFEAAAAGAARAAAAAITLTGSNGCCRRERDERCKHE